MPRVTSCAVFPDSRFYKNFQIPDFIKIVSRPDFLKFKKTESNTNKQNKNLSAILIFNRLIDMIFRSLTRYFKVQFPIFIKLLYNYQACGSEPEPWRWGAAVFWWGWSHKNREALGSRIICRLISAITNAMVDSEIKAML